MGLALSTVFAPEDVGRVLRWAGSLMNAIGWAIFTVILALSYLLALILDPLVRLLLPLVQALMALLGLAMPQQLPKVPELNRELNDLETISITIPEPLRWVLLAATFLIIALAFALALQRLRLEAEADVDETRESLLTREFLGEQWARFWRNWLDRLRRAQQVILNPFLSLEGEVEGRRTIRAIYQSLLTVTHALGHPRRRGQTPLEYRQALEGVLPNPEAALNTITEGYLQARYGHELPSPEQVERARQAWDQLESTLGIEIAEP
jgi:hypothetical protein